MSTRRSFLRYGAASVACGLTPSLAGCSVGRHHRPGLLISNHAQTVHRLSVSVERLHGPTLFDTRISIAPDESLEHSDALPHPADTADEEEFRASVTHDSVLTQTDTFGIGSGFHRLWIIVESEESLRIVHEIH